MVALGLIDSESIALAYLVGVQLLEQIDGLLEIVAHLHLGGVLLIAVRLDGVDTSAWNMYVSDPIH